MRACSSTSAARAGSPPGPASCAPPSSCAISREIESPRPVPPYFRLVVPSACWNASKMSRCLSRDAGVLVHERCARGLATGTRELCAAQQLRDLAGDRESEAGAAVLPARGPVGLLE